MEQQFILRLPECLLGSDLSTMHLERVSDNEVQLISGSTVYRGVICRLPTIVESHRAIENKIFKTADISTLIVIFGEKTVKSTDELMEKKREIERSGLTPPMFCIRDRRATQSSSQTVEDYSEVEKKVAELLREDSLAEQVEVFEKGTSDEDEIDQFAAAIENELIEETPQQLSDDTPTPSLTTPGNEIKKGSGGAEMSRVIQHSDGGQRNEGVADYVNELSYSPPAESLSVEGKEGPGANIERVTGDSGSDELAAIDEKIRERKELLGKTVNPILKKRFSQMLEQLEKEREEILRNMK